MHKIDLDRQMRKLDSDRRKVLNAYIKNGRTIEEFERNYKDRFVPTLIYDEDGNLVEKGFYDNTTIIRIK